MKMKVKTCSTINMRLIAIAAISMIIVALFSGTAVSRNWDWDQNHDCVEGGGGDEGWGKYGYDGVFRGGYTSKECCELYCKVCPVYANTGRYQKTYSDLTIPGIGPTLQIQRTYNSQEWSSSLLGYGWTFNFGRKLIISRDKTGERRIGVLLDTGEKNYYREDLDGTLTRLTEYGANYELIKSGSDTYTIGFSNGTWYDIRSDGKIEKITDKNQNEMVFEYNSVGCLSRITNASGNYIDFTIGANGKIANISDNFGRTIAYAYDENGNLVSVTDPMGHATQYVYNNKNYLVQIIDARGNTVEAISYDNNQPPRVTSLVEKGETYTITYFDDRTEKRDSQGHRWAYYYNDIGVIERIIDPLNNVKRNQLNKITATSIDWQEDLNGKRTTYIYDDFGNIISETDALGNTWTYTYRAGTDLLESETNPLNVVTLYEYDSRGNQTAMVLDSGGANESRWTFTYDAKGNRLSTSGPSGQTTTFTYDSNGMLLQVTDPLGAITTFNYDTFGNLTQQIDANGNITISTYDLNGRLLSATDALGYTISHTYDETGNRVSSVDALGNITNFAYDIHGNITQQTDAMGNTTTFNYNQQGKLIKIIDPLGNETAYSYDAIGNQLSMTDSLGHVTAYQYDAKGQLIRETDPNGNITQYNYDAIGRKLSFNDSQGGLTSFSYDAIGNLIELTDPKGNITSFEYDSQGHLIRKIRPMLEEESFQYDVSGRLIQKIDAKGQRCDYVYDIADRVIEIRYYADSSGDNLIKTVIFSYDNYGNLLSYDNGNVNANYTYDAINRKISETINYGNFSLTNRYSYNGNGLLINYTGPNEIPYQYSYNDINQIVAVSIPGLGDVVKSSFQWNHPQKIVFPGGVSRQLYYDTMQSIENIVAYNPLNNIIMNYSYEYDNARNVIVKNTEHGAYGYSYDSLYHLIQSSNPDLTYDTFAYDLAGNRISSGIGSNTWTYNANNQLTAYEDIAFFYDSNGSATIKNTSGSIETFTYNVENRLSNFARDNSNMSVEYSYDIFGRRIWKEVEGIRTYFHYAEQGLVGEYDSFGNELKTYGYAPDSNWTSDPLFMKQGNDYYWYQNDHLGTPQIMTNSNGDLVWSAKYSSFGFAITDGNSTVENNLRFGGQYFDHETGLHYNFHRYYDPKIGRYLKEDPIGTDGGINVYSYANSNPVNFIDPFGLIAKACVRRFAFGPVAYLFPPRHCYVSFSDGSTISYDNKNVGPDPAPNTWFKACFKIKDQKGKCTCTDKCIKDAMFKCDPSKYKFFSNNCCDCVRRSLKSCGCKVPLGISTANLGF
ncbi:RHS repeat-associated core domain-containing protein [Desulfosarcina ovata]|uniref:Type IV secretion protein Rhs n=1 Tax=Desulfosarcina ovata subsp. ovata TaxID=2752305 RepID=A0A5K8A5L9_9BACT|nr:RHS repeat-associated core domain-containing protein [Desulfosarcina ovata]BBO87540.1 hypothetical protein DSCOOX_07200 [Desulfosarcina ovata subsp. ovata]